MMIYFCVPGNYNCNQKDTRTFTGRLQTEISISGNIRKPKHVSGAERVGQPLTGGKRLKEETLQVHFS